MKFFCLGVEEILFKLNSREEGLSLDEVAERIERDGKNRLTSTKQRSKFSKFLDEFRDLMIIVLIGAAIVSFVLAIINNESFVDSIIILMIVILNAILGFVQELKADKTIESLKNMQVKNVKVKRNGQICVVNSEDVVKGDILVLEAGDTVVADARVIYASSLKVDESPLTGESIPVCKDILVLDADTPLHLRSNMIYSGTNIVYGKCQAVVCEIGMNTEFGIIAQSLSTEDKEITPLQKKIDGISKFLSFVIAIIILVMFIVGISKKMNLMEVVMLSISLAVAAIPEGLPAVITIILSLGMSNLAKKRAIVRKMSSVETLGCTEVICSDKTGTITQNKMKVREVFYNNKTCNISDIDSNNILFKAMILDNDVEKNNEEYIGDPTEIALYECLEKYVDIDFLRKNNKRVGELPFDSERKMMSTLNQDINGIRLYTKGSFDSLIDRCSYIYEDETVNVLNDEKRAYLKGVELEKSAMAYRVLAYAYKDIGSLDKLDNELEKDLIFVGMTAMIDPPRYDVREAIECAKEAHIRPVMITGDSLETAKAIAREVGILTSDEEAITGVELDMMSEDELRKNVSKYSVYARVSPTNKLAIVNAWKQNNKVVAMTGDGVNDAPALKAANIGIGMGITGTEVSKEASDIVLADDSFSTIVDAVFEGRRIFDNIRNVLVYLLTGNISEILVVFIGMLCGIEIFLPIQLLYINLITDSIPAIALAFEKGENDIMKRKVRKNDSSFFTPFITFKIGIASLLKASTILFVYFYNLNLYGSLVAETMSFLTLVLLEMLFAYSCRNLKRRILNKNVFDNSYLNKSMLLLIIVQLIVFLSPVKGLFNIVSLSFSQILTCIFVVIILFLIDEVLKGIISKKFRDN